ncbi:MAG: hypothetical protein ACFBQW_08790 [Sphingomonadaceae bacterium]
MNEFDLDELGHIWRQQPSREEMTALVKSARRIRKRARIALIFDYMLAILVSGAVLASVIISARLETTIVGAAAIFIMLYSQIRERRYRMAELKSMTGNTEKMLDLAIEREEGRLKRSRSSLLYLGPATLLGIIFASVSSRKSIIQLIDGDSQFDPVVLAIVGLALLVITVHFFFTMKTSRKRLERLKYLRQDYNKENPA